MGVLNLFKKSKKQEILKFFSPEEREYINNPDSTEKEQIGMML